MYYMYSFSAALMLYELWFLFDFYIELDKYNAN